MQIPMERLQRRLIELYRLDSSRFTPFAFWKVQKMTAEGEGFYAEQNDCLYAIRDRQLLFYHSGDERGFHVPLNVLGTLDFVVLRIGEFDRIKDRLEGLDLSSGWTLYYDFSHSAPTMPPPGYEVADFDFADEAQFVAAANLLNYTIAGKTYDFGGNAYPDGCFHPDRLRRWTAHSAFDPSLWVCLRERCTGRLVAFGVSNYHKQVRETDLDWIYVLPEHQGRGVGRALIAETVRRSIDRSSVIRVSGVADGFYKKCGFYEKQLWGYAVRPGFSMNEQ